MGADQSKERKLYDAVRDFDIQEMRSLHAQGASVNWISPSGKTPLFLACSAAFLLPTAIVLLEMGADVNYYHPGSHVGTALSRAASRRLEETVRLLLSHGANPLLANSFGRNSLDEARIGGHTSIVRAIEDKICFFSGWVDVVSNPRESFLLPLRLAEGKIWAVVLPPDASLSRDPGRMNIALYGSRESPRPFLVIDLRTYRLSNAEFGREISELIFSHRSFGTQQLKLTSTNPDDSALLRTLFGPAPAIPTPNAPSSETVGTVASPTARVSLPSFERGDVEKAIAASIQSAIQEGIPLSEVNVELEEDKNKARDETGVGGSLSPARRGALADAGTSGGGLSCVVCADRSAECACVPCGHLAGCKECMAEVKRKGFGCPVCRTPIDRILKIYTV